MIKLYENQSVDMKAVLLYETDSAEEAVPEEGEKKLGVFLSAKRVVEDGAIVLQIGLGKKEELTLLKAKRAGAKAVKAMLSDGAKKVTLDACCMVEAGEDPEMLSALAEGAALALYRSKTWKKESKKAEYQLYVDGGSKDCRLTEDAVKEAALMASAVADARDLVNEPPNFLTPERMAEWVKERAEAVGIEVEIKDRDQAHEMGMNAFLAVGDSSANPPRLMVLRYRGNEGSDTVLGYIGKGITYDTGGYCLKPAGSMKTMKSDMGGGAAVFGAICALAEKKAKVNVTAVIPAAENRISDSSYLPGDVITSMSGKTIEIGNTDAEGRLLLADGLTYAIQKEKVTHLVDIATLTGAVVNMFGSTTAGLMTNDENFYSVFQAAAQKSAEQYWRLPDFDEYKDMIKTPIADIQNVSKGGCGTIAGGLFVAAFNENLPWIHLDIAGTAYTEKPLWEFLASGATGAGVATLYQLALAFEGK